jgi:hypothetical protein
MARAPGRRGGQSGPSRMGSDRPDGAIFTSPAKVGSGQRRPGTRRVGRLPPSLRRPGFRRSLGRGHPVTKESGKHRAAHFRWACNKRFRAAITTFAGNSRHASAWAAKIYNDARATGKDQPQAIRILACAWIRVTWPCWLDSIPYDPAPLAEQSAKSKLRPEVGIGSVMTGPVRQADHRAVPAARRRPPPMTGGCDPRPRAGPRQAGAAGTRRVPVAARVAARR